jgi:hypothetical protein
MIFLNRSSFSLLVYVATFPVVFVIFAIFKLITLFHCIILVLIKYAPSFL